MKKAKQCTCCGCYATRKHPVGRSGICKACTERKCFMMPGLNKPKSIPHADPSPIADQYKEQLQDRAARVAMTGGREDY